MPQRLPTPFFKQHRIRTFVSAARLLIAGASLNLYAATEVRLQPTAPTPEVIGTIGASGDWGLAAGFRSITPWSSPFSATHGTTDYAFRFQSSGGFGLELTHPLWGAWELGVNTGYITYEARSLLPNNDQFETARLRQVPVTGVLRYRQKTTGWAIEGEVAAGLSFGKLDLSSTNQSFGSHHDSLTFIKGHVAGGFGYPWSDDVSFHGRAGLGLDLLGSKSYTTPSIIVKRSNIVGVFLGGDLRYSF